MENGRTGYPRRATIDDLHPISWRSDEYLHERTPLPLESGNSIAV